MCISASVLFTAVCIGLVPNSYKTELDARAKLCESLAIQFCVGTQEKQIDIFNAFAPMIVKRDPDILSVAIRKTDGYLVAATDNHKFFWKDVSANRSTETHIQVPVFVNDERYGTIEVCFTALNSNWLIGSIREFHLPLILFMLVSEFIAFKLYLRKALRHLDPSSVIPGRVKAALDNLSEGIVVTDSKDQIVLANEAFTRFTGQPFLSILGNKLSSLPCIKKTSERKKLDFPWQKTLSQGKAEKGVPIALTDPSGEVFSSIVNTIPISDPEVKQKGVMASFTDVTELEQKNRALVEASRLAGMAEVATDVLHNVGNVLNSVNVSAASIDKSLSDPQLNNVKKVAEMISEHMEDIGNYLTKDSQGKHIPTYLIKTIKKLIADQVKLMEKVQNIQANIGHISEIISMQQSHARSIGFQIEASLIEVIEDAIKINHTTLERNNICLVKEIEDFGIVTIDKPRILQIVINLIRNSSESLAKSDQEDKQLTIRCYKHTENMIRIEVSDNGIGISSENIKKIFRHGFTTKEKGHGFGLHSSALAAQEMGGSLSAHSEGVGYGATFRLEFPLINEAQNETGTITQSKNTNY